MSILSEFREFAIKGNAVDLAVGVVIGAAFGKIVNSLVADIIMPPISLLLGRVNLVNKFVDLSGQGHVTLAEAKAAGAATINYGMFISNILEFLIIGICIFLVVKWINNVRERFHCEPIKK